MGSRWSQVVVDALDPVRLGHWWAEVLGFQVLSQAPGRPWMAGRLVAGVTAGFPDSGRRQAQAERDVGGTEQERGAVRRQRRGIRWPGR